jgi:mono/diheme cytochrome c family protein
MRKTHVLWAASMLLAMSACYGKAQEIGRPGQGRAAAERLCAQCHAIEKAGGRSPNEAAPPFASIAAVPGMTSIALTVALTTSHRAMPNIMLEADDRADIIAYILSLK